MGVSVMLAAILIIIAFLAGAFLVWMLTRRALARSREAVSTLDRLSRSLRRLESVLDSTGNGILVYDLQEKILFANHLLGEWFGVAPGTAIGRPLSEVLQETVAPHLTHPARLLARQSRVRDHLDAVTMEEYEQISPAHRFLRIYGGPVREGDEVIGRIVVLTDLTERRRREAEREALGRIAEALVHEPTREGAARVVVDEASALIGGVFVGLWVIGPRQNQLQLIVQRGFDSHAIEEVQSLSFSILDTLGENYPTDLLENPVAADEQYPLYSWAAERRFTSCVALPLVSHDHHVGLLAVGRTDRSHWSDDERRLFVAIRDLASAAVDSAQIYEAAVARAREAEEARTSLQQFLGMVSHDLRGPTSVVLGYSQMMLHRGDLPATDEQSIRMIQDAAQRMGRLIDDLLTAARIGSGRFEVRPSRTNLAEVASYAIAQQQAANPTRQIALEAKGDLVVMGDAERIAQLLNNLLSNALKYSPNGGIVRLTLQSAGHEVEVAVTDQGVGLSADEISTLFQPFRRVNPPRTSSGTGLGLYIAKGIVEAHGGKIWVESQPEVGSTFRVSLPRERQNE